MTVIDVVLWIVVTVLALASVVAAVLAIRTGRPLLALPSLVPVLLGIVLVAAGSRVDPGPLAIVLAFALGALGIVAGSPLSLAVLQRTAPPEERAGAHGGILVREEGVAAGSPPREVMRGGSVIGYLERAAVVGAVAIGHPEVLAAVIAVKGLGRFSELDTSEARERFIIGTLVSLIWSTLCAALIWLPRS